MQGYTLNQVEDLEGYNLYNTDPVLREAVQKWSSPQAAGRLEAYGKTLGTAEVLNWGSLANRHPPQLQRYTRLGAESNRVDFHESWHSLMRMAMRNGLHSRAWLSDQDGAQVERAAAFFMHGQVEAGSLCPLTMTSAALPVLMRESWFASLEPHLRSQEYDSRNLPIHQKNAILIGMGLTERQGGSDLRNTQTVAEAFTHGGQLAGYKLTGEKWFYSVPTADAHLVLARSSAGLSCFLFLASTPAGKPMPYIYAGLKTSWAIVQVPAQRSSFIRQREYWSEKKGGASLR
ncbi:acyl-CoA dehydrogenase family protein [Paenalcaligenes niemegkensis]|uniref:acyl-CoA dehydrogenase family protein n=1 Tax=Paenalcaligenes niemegkensis TaxID=2895469 RepID=UPI001EE88863|nr:acyl-CoA dehydrogenase family protein [Paenalcaligenes niemegkensis]MCQ9615687.1 acyl-CoA dehydrogenase family protein [Paenalcaligenes niemegkensis]